MGGPFSKSYFPRRWRMAGMQIASDFVAVLEGLQGDQDFIRILFQPARHQTEFGTIIFDFFNCPEKKFCEC